MTTGMRLPPLLMLLGALGFACGDEGGIDDDAGDADAADGADEAGGCAPGTVDLDGDPANGCECVVAPETCNDLDDDCDGVADDGEGACGGVCPLEHEPGTACDGPDTDPCEDDVWECDGPNAVVCSTGPDGVEECNGIDDDCDGLTDEGVCPLRVDLFLLREISVCAIGNACAEAECIGLSDDDGVMQVSYADDDDFRGVRPDDPDVASAAVSQCLRLTLDAAATATALDAANEWVADAIFWTRGAIVPEIVVHEIPFAEMTMSRWGPGLWVGPWDLRPIAAGLVSPETDFVVVTHGIRDDATGLHHDLGGCGGTYGSDMGLGGAGYSWVPRTANAFFFECADRTVYMHEWLHQVHWALNNLSGFDDLYDGVYPPCGEGDPDPTLWFPDTHECDVDPDFPRCGRGDCGDGDAVNRHMLMVHWAPERLLLGNHCRDGVRDYGETGVDSGGQCP